MSKANLDQVLLDVRKLSEEAKYRELAERLKNSSELMENQTVATLDLFISTLDVKGHSLGFLQALYVQRVCFYIRACVRPCVCVCVVCEPNSVVYLYMNVCCCFVSAYIWISSVYA